MITYRKFKWSRDRYRKALRWLRALAAPGKRRIQGARRSEAAL